MKLFFMTFIYMIYLKWSTSLFSIKTTNPRIIKTRYGQIQGLTQTFESKYLKSVDIYLGIPYATAPTGRNRFSPTGSPSPWEGVKVADSVKPVCPQKLPNISNETEALNHMPKGRLEYLKRLFPHLKNQSEDCLYLNIYAPSRESQDSTNKYPVLLFIHGESYDWGSGNSYDGSVLSSYTDEVIVTINYRLGVLGFLNANVAPHEKARVANYGLMDQIAALHWVQNNIAFFGGEPENVTIMGHGTGAACVHFLAISPTVMHGLFKRAILLSGSALSTWAIVDNPVSYALKLAKAVNCTIPEDISKDHELLVDCLRGSSLEGLLEANIQAPTFLSAFGPSIDGVVIKPDFQKDLLSYMGPEFQGFGQPPKKADHGASITSDNKYDLLFGVTTNEALSRFAEKDIQSGFEGDRRDKIIRTYIRNTYMYHLTEIFYTVVNEYTDWEKTVQHPANTRDACIQALSDAQFVAPLVQTGDLFTLRHKKKQDNQQINSQFNSSEEDLPNTYFYVFSHQSKDSDYPQKMSSVHGEDLQFVFGAPLVERLGHFRRNFSKQEIVLSEDIILYFANFVKSGNPNSIDHHELILPISKEKTRFRDIPHWDQYDPVHQKYLEIATKPKLKTHYRAHQLSVWLRLVPELHRAGMEDVEPRHNLFKTYGNYSLYDGLVREDPFTRISEEFQKRNFTTELPTTTDYSMTTCVSLVQGTNLQNIHNASTDTLASLDAAGYAAYSTALSVTIAIGCSLLILNVLIFAGVYYQRDKTRLEVKSMQQQQMMNQQCGTRGFTDLKQPPSPRSHYAGGQLIVDVENEMLRCNVMKSPYADATSLIQQGQSTNTLPHPHHYQKQHQQPHATFPRSSIVQDIQIQGPPNGSINLTVPRAPPPPRSKSPPEIRSYLQTGTGSTISPAAISEMRV